jgi:hypothetical protein
MIEKFVWCEECEFMVLLHLSNSTAYCVCGAEMKETGRMETR